MDSGAEGCSAPHEWRAALAHWAAVQSRRAPLWLLRRALFITLKHAGDGPQPARPIDGRVTSDNGPRRHVADDARLCSELCAGADLHVIRDACLAADER